MSTPTAAVRRPMHYRENWSHLGTYFVIGESTDGHSTHSVYVEKHYLDAYRESGRWPDGAVLVKEVMHTAGARLTTGDANWATTPDVWFVMVKDSEGRFPENPALGRRLGLGAVSGWGPVRSGGDQITRKTALAATFRRKLRISSTCKATRLCARSLDAMSSRSGALTTRMASTAASRSARQRGGEVFAQVCAICHAIDSDRTKLGPGLAVVAREGKLPSGIDASEESILRQINNGGRGMPAFERHLDEQQKADVIAYLKTPH